MKVVTLDDATGSYRDRPHTERLKLKIDALIERSHIACESEFIARVRDAGIVLSFRPTESSLGKEGTQQLRAQSPDHEGAS